MPLTSAGGHVSAGSSEEARCQLSSRHAESESPASQWCEFFFFPESSASTGWRIMATVAPHPPLVAICANCSPPPLACVIVMPLLIFPDVSFDGAAKGRRFIGGARRWNNRRLVESRGSGRKSVAGERNELQLKMEEMRKRQ